MEEFTLRDLNAKDMFLVGSIIGNIGVDQFSEVLTYDNIRTLVSDTEGEEGRETVVGFGLIAKAAGVIFKNLDKCETDIFTLLSKLSGMTKAQVEELPPGTFAKMIMAVIKQDGFRDFFMEFLGSLNMIS